MRHRGDSRTADADRIAGRGRLAFSVIRDVEVIDSTARAVVDEQFVIVSAPIDGDSHNARRRTRINDRAAEQRLDEIVARKRNATHLVIVRRGRAGEDERRSGIHTQREVVSARSADVTVARSFSIHGSSGSSGDIQERDVGRCGPARHLDKRENRSVCDSRSSVVEREGSCGASVVAYRSCDGDIVGRYSDEVSRVGAAVERQSTHCQRSRCGRASR